MRALPHWRTTAGSAADAADFGAAGSGETLSDGMEEDFGGDEGADDLEFDDL